MDHYRLRIASPTPSELTLDAGMHGIGPHGDGLGVVADDRATVRFCIDRRGVWMTVAEGARGIHVNGREVQRMAMLRVGDAIFVDGVEMRLVSARPVAVLPAGEAANAAIGDAANGDDDPRVVLRGVGGRYHGRCFTLVRPRLVGRHRDADIRIDEPAFADRHARLERVDGGVLLHDLGSAEGSVVNGEPVHDALLRPGDQVVFDAHHRFVVEAPSRARAWRALSLDELEQGGDELPLAPAAARAGAKLRLPWLLLAALVIAALLSALLLFGAG